MKRNVKWALMSAAAICGLTGSAALAADGAAYYAGKTVTYVVATAAGGGYDAYGRLTAEFMEKHIPGSTFIVKNVPGAGGLIGTASINASKPDGLTIGTFNIGLVYSQLAGYEGVKFDLAKMSWVGKAASDSRVIVIADGSPIKSFADLQGQKTPVNFATGGVGGNLHSEVTMVTSALHLPIKILPGYNGNEDRMAMRRGEIVGAFGGRASFEDFIKTGYGRYIAQVGGNDPDLPQLSSFATDEQGKSLIALIQSQADLSRLTAGPPSIPAAQLEALRVAYKQAMEDKDLLAKAEKMGLPIDPAYGDTVHNSVKAALGQSPETIAMIKTLMTKKD